jgi:hypothetical protein
VAKLQQTGKHWNKGTTGEKETKQDKHKEKATTEEMNGHFSLLACCRLQRFVQAEGEDHLGFVQILQRALMLSKNECSKNTVRMTHPSMHATEKTKTRSGIF